MTGTRGRFVIHLRTWRSGQEDGVGLTGLDEIFLDEICIAHLNT